MPGDNQVDQSNVPDVLFVDEDGNPIEAGHENIIYVDENGNEIPEEIAIQLLDSGKYIDSRELYVESDDLPQSSLPASQFGSLSKTTGAISQTEIQAELIRRASSQALFQAQAQAQAQAMALAEAQARVFAQAQAELKQREEELASIEADAARESRLDTPSSVRQRLKSGQSMSGSELQVQKSQSGRRLLQPPPKKVESKSNDRLSVASEVYNLDQLVKTKIIERVQSKQSHVSSRVYSESDQVVNEDDQNYLDDEVKSQLETRITEQRQHQLLKEKLLKKQQEILQQHLQERLDEPEPIRYTAQSFVSQPVEEDDEEEAQQAFNMDSASTAAFVPQEEEIEYVKSRSRQETTKTLSKQETPVSLSNASREDLKNFSNNYNIGLIRLLGHLSGNKVVSNVNQLSMEEIEKFYELAEKHEEEKEKLEEIKEEKELVDPLDPDLFKDEIVEIDFGAIDAYTAALNAHINAQVNGMEPPSDLHFPSHILTSNHATFIDTQLLLGEAMYNTMDTKNAVNVNAQLLSPPPNMSSPFRSANNKSNMSQTNTNNAEYEYENYSRSNSFGSIVDIQSQAAYSVGDLNQAQQAYAAYQQQQQQQIRPKSKQSTLSNSEFYNRNLNNTNLFSNLATR